MKLTNKLLIVSAMVLAVGSVQQVSAQQMPMGKGTMMNDGQTAVVVLSPTEGNNVTGVVYFTQTDKGVHVSGMVENLTPGKHGFHVHEFGDCSDSAGKTAGGHFNPTHKKHGDRLSADRHIGDLGNIVADKDGRATIDFVDTVISLGGPNSIIGRGIIVHGGADDLVSQPSGNAGPRVACGTIGVAKSKAPDMMK